MKIFLTLFLVYLSICLSAQTLIGPTIGYDFATLETQHILKEAVYDQNDRILEVPLEIKRSRKDNPSGRNSIAFGFQIQKMLSEQWSLGLRGSYSKKEFTELIDDNLGQSVFLPEYKISYRQIGLSVLLNRKIKEKISVGIGSSKFHFTNWDRPTIDFDPYAIIKRAYGLDFQLGYYLGPVYLAVDYTQLLKISDGSGYMTGASSLAISGTYFFELRKRK